MVGTVNHINSVVAPMICFSYPVYIGIQKQLLFLTISPFEMDEVYEFASLAFAAMPYRFIYLNLDNWGQAIGLFAIKYTYKILVYFVSLKYKKQIGVKKRTFKSKVKSMCCPCQKKK
jgi:hypothetical protein